MGGSFLQSSEWEEFQKSVGRKTWRIGGALVVRHDLRGGFNYLYCPRPKVAIGNWLVEVEKIARKEKAVFLKIDPADPSKSDFPQEVRLPKRKVSGSLQPRKTVVLDLQKSEDELLAAMHEKTRYNIRLAERHVVQITNRDPGAFWELLEETAQRDGFHTHEKGYYEKLLAMRSENFSNELFFAEYQGKVSATALVNFYKPAETATYLHGGSSREHKEMMTPHLLHWRIIQEAKRRGFRHYDLWGIDEKKWPGITRFKMGFGGKIIEYPGPVDIVYRPFFYQAYRILRTLL